MYKTETENNIASKKDPLKSGFLYNNKTLNELELVLDFAAKHFYYTLLPNIYWFFDQSQITTCKSTLKCMEWLSSV
jgi:hypothetical protein